MAFDTLLGKPFDAAKLWQIDYESRADDFAAGAFDKLDSRFSRAAGRNQIIHDQYALILGDRILMHLDDIDAVFERVFLPNRFPRQLAFLADGNEPASEPVRNGAAENEAPRFDTGNRINFGILERLGHGFDRLFQPLRIAKECRDVPEHDAGLGVVWDCTDQAFQALHGISLRSNSGRKIAITSCPRYKEHPNLWDFVIRLPGSDYDDVFQRTMTMAQGPMAMAEPNFPPLGDEQNDDLPRTFRREKEARAREARERAAQERAAAPSLPTGSAAVNYGPSPEPRVDADPNYSPAVVDMPYPASVQRIDVPFLHLVVFFLKAVLAAIPALILLTVILWFAGSALQALFPELIKMKILISLPN